MGENVDSRIAREQPIGELSHAPQPGEIAEELLGIEFMRERRCLGSGSSEEHDVAAIRGEAPRGGGAGAFGQRAVGCEHASANGRTLLAAFTSARAALA